VAVGSGRVVEARRSSRCGRSEVVLGSLGRLKIGNHVFDESGKHTPDFKGPELTQLLPTMYAKFSIHFSTYMMLDMT